MTFEIIWTRKAAKDLKAIDKKIARRIYEEIEVLKSQNNVFLEKVKGQEFYKYRIGKYRVFIDKYPASKKLVILRIIHRRKAYKNLN